MIMNSDKLAKYIFFTFFTIGIIGFSLVFGMWSGYHQTAPFKLVETTWENLKSSTQAVEETSFLRPDYLLQPARYPGSGVTINTLPDDGSLIFMSGFFRDQDTNELRLMRRDGSTVNRWPLHFNDILPNPDGEEHGPASDWNVDIHGAIALPDGSVVFNFEYSAIAKLDRCGNVLWTLLHKGHHSVETSERGGYWILGERWIRDIADADTPYPPFLPPIRDTKILRISDDGEIVAEISIPKLFYDNNLESLLTSSAQYFTLTHNPKNGNEIVHANKVEELSAALAADFPMFDAGDLLVSMRQLNMLMVVDPDDLKIKWWKIGPWKRQHDPEFLPGGKIQVFNNNTYKDIALGRDGKERKMLRTTTSTPRLSNILEFNFADGSTEVRYGYGGEPGEEMLSVVRGKIDPTDSGGILVTESDGGRVFEIDANRTIVWQYVNRYDDDEVAELTEARLYDKDYFKVADWSCNN